MCYGIDGTTLSYLQFFFNSSLIYCILTDVKGRDREGLKERGKEQDWDPMSTPHTELWGLCNTRACAEIMRAPTVSGSWTLQLDHCSTLSLSLEPGLLHAHASADGCPVRHPGISVFPLSPSGLRLHLHSFIYPLTAISLRGEGRNEANTVHIYDLDLNNQLLNNLLYYCGAFSFEWTALLC